MNDQIPFAEVSGSTARFSMDGRYRYELARRWANGSAVTWIMLNPSTADASVDDPTIGKCIRFSRKWGFGALAVVNLFALRATDPKALRDTDDPIGPENDDAIHDAVVRSRTVIAAWGAHALANGRADRVLEDLEQLGRSPLCLGTTKAGHPRHPLYVRGSTHPRRLHDAAGPYHSSEDPGGRSRP